MSITNSQYDNIMKVYAERQKTDRNVLKEHLDEIEKKAPQYFDIQNTIVDINSERIKANISGDVQKSKLLADQISMLEKEREVLLKASGFPADYDKMSYLCSDCKDTGFTGSLKCHCFKQMEAELLYNASNIKELLEKENFSTFSFEYFDRNIVDPSTGKTAFETMHINFETAHKMADTFKPGDMNLLFTGNAGTGKTFLSNCIAYEVLKQGFSVVYLSATSLFNRLAESTFSKGSEEPDQITDCDLLIIDDLGTEYNNSFVSSQLFYCLNERKLLRKSTIISTNLDMNQIRDAYSERVSSRILENYKICRFYNKDIRIIKRHEA